MTANPKLDHMSLFDALSAAMAEMPTLGKDDRNDQQRFNYRSLESLLANSRAVLSRHGIGVIPTDVRNITYEAVESKGGAYGYRCTLEAQFTVGFGNETVQAWVPGEAIDYGDKSTTKALQMAFKYLLTDMLQVSSGDPDPDGQSFHDARPVDTPTPEQIAHRATNALKAEIVRLCNGDKDEAVGLYETLAAEHGLTPQDDITDDTIRTAILAAAQEVAGHE